MQLIRMLICLFRGHKKWKPRDASEATWNFMSWRDADNSGVDINVCKRCGKIYSERVD